MHRSITLGSNNKLTDLILLLIAAFIKILSNTMEFILLLGAAFLKLIHNEDIGFFEMLMLMFIGIFISHVLNLLEIGL